MAYNRTFVMAELQRQHLNYTYKNNKVAANSQYGGHTPSSIKLWLPNPISTKNEITL